MKVTRSAKDEFAIHIGKREKQLLLGVLSLYPRMPSGQSCFTRRGGLPDQESSQRLLDEALREQREQNRKQLDSFMSDPRKMADSDKGAELRFTRAELEWFLQVLNDLRVGSWVRLGSPEEKIYRLTPKTARDVWVMEVAGYFQSNLLEALTGREPI